MQPSYPLQAVRHLGRISAASLPVPAGAPEEGFARPGCTALTRWRREEARGLEARLQFPAPRLTLKWGKKQGSQLGAAGRASFQTATRRKPFMHLT